MKCDLCGKELEIGRWPYCPHGTPGGMLGEYRAHWEDNLGPAWQEGMLADNTAIADQLAASGIVQ